MHGLVSGAETTCAVIVLESVAADGSAVPNALPGQLSSKVDRSSGEICEADPYSGGAIRAGYFRRAGRAGVGKTLSPLGTGAGLTFLVSPTDGVNTGPQTLMRRGCPVRPVDRHARLAGGSVAAVSEPVRLRAGSRIQMNVEVEDAVGS